MIRPVWLVVFMVALMAGGASAPVLAGSAKPAPIAGVLWQLGRADDSSAEFSDYPAMSPAETGCPAMMIPGDWRSRSDWRLVPRGLRGSSNPTLDIRYRLRVVPKYGVIFTLKLLQAPKSGPQMAVFSNQIMAGLMQFWGTAGTTSPYQWKRTYRLYIPREMLTRGLNTLRLETVRPLWCDARVDPEIWWKWDYLKMTALPGPASEPIHGAVAYLGTTLKMSSHDFKVDDDTLTLARLALPWLGIAYSGNTIRADFWVDVGSQQPRRLEYLKLLRDLNMTVCVDYISGSHFHNDAAGQIPTATRAAIDAFFKQYGSLFQYYETGNEPCMFGGGFAETMNLARYIDKIKPPGVKTTAPGWAYGGGKGTPKNWDADPALRRQVEDLCQAINGHSYGYSYADNRGGSFVENLATYGGVEDGWPKEYVNTETGTNNWHSEENGTHFPSSQPNAQAFDRILRAHLAVVNRTMQHAAIFDDFGLFQAPRDWADPTTLSAYPGVNGQDTRLKTFRRLALAYATHGAPLPYVYLNRSAVAGKKVYFRAVNTGALPPLPVSGGVSNRILLNFVNFEPTPQTMKVRVTLPRTGRYQGDRFGPGASYAIAHRAVTLTAAPTVDLTVSLGGGDSVQYILEATDKE